MTDDPDAETSAFAHRRFDLARAGHGDPSAPETARFVDLPELLTLPTSR
ncbi:hypothetical protein V6U89_19760 [Micromonospora sp. CPCC 206171]